MQVKTISKQENQHVACPYCTKCNVNRHGDYVKETTTPLGGKYHPKANHWSSMDDEENLTSQGRL